MWLHVKSPSLTDEGSLRSRERIFINIQNRVKLVMQITLPTPSHITCNLNHYIITQKCNNSSQETCRKYPASKRYMGRHGDTDFMTHHRPYGGRPLIFSCKLKWSIMVQRLSDFAIHVFFRSFLNLGFWAADYSTAQYCKCGFCD